MFAKSVITLGVLLVANGLFYMMLGTPSIFDWLPVLRQDAAATGEARYVKIVAAPRSSTLELIGALSGILLIASGLVLNRSKSGN